jgi:hypothetical protein
VKIRDRYGFIDVNDSVIITANYETANNFSEGFVSVKKNGKWGFIDENGKTVIPFEYDMAFFFVNGIAKVKKDDRQFYIDKHNKFVKEEVRKEDPDAEVEHDKKKAKAH